MSGKIGIALTLFIFAAASLASEASAQAPPVAPNRFDSVASLLENGGILRVKRASETVEGTLVGTTTDGLVIRSRDGTAIRVATSNIEVMWQRDNSAGQGAFFGGLTGAVALGGFAFLVGNGMCESSSGCGSDTMKLALYGGAFGAAGGSVIGAGIGTLVHRWVRVFP
jgi:hypothetical protein